MERRHRNWSVEIAHSEVEAPKATLGSKDVESLTETVMDGTGEQAVQRERRTSPREGSKMITMT